MVKNIVTSLAESGSNVPRWILTNFNDPHVELVINTRDVEELMASLNGLKFGGGGDIWGEALKGKGISQLAIRKGIEGLSCKPLSISPKTYFCAKFSNFQQMFS